MTGRVRKCDVEKDGEDEALWWRWVMQWRIREEGCFGDEQGTWDHREHPFHPYIYMKDVYPSYPTLVMKDFAEDIEYRTDGDVTSSLSTSLLLLLPLLNIFITAQNNTEKYYL